jgi:hypothetical protein
MNPTIYNIKYKCPEHKVLMIRSETQYGLRFGCPENGCDYVAWVSYNGQKSTPANQETRDARQKAHDAFDQLWKSGRFQRGLMYKALAVHLGRSQKKTHIRLFDIETCEKVHEFVRKF